MADNDAIFKAARSARAHKVALAGRCCPPKPRHLQNKRRQLATCAAAPNSTLSAECRQRRNRVEKYPGMANPHSSISSNSKFPPRGRVFLCRSGGRSHETAAAAAQAGYRDAYNVLEGFEGDRDAGGHRNTTGGWRARGLPWSQS